MALEYRLHCTLRGHSADVRAVAAAPGGGVLTTSRDKTARLWMPQPEGWALDCLLTIIAVLLFSITLRSTILGKKWNRVPCLYWGSTMFVQRYRVLFYVRQSYICLWKMQPEGWAVVCNFFNHSQFFNKVLRLPKTLIVQGNIFVLNHHSKEVINS